MWNFSFHRHILFIASKSDGSGWQPKDKVGFLQVPQDFYNISPHDPLGHGNRIFFGPIMEGKDGAGSVTCCGTGVVFPRDSLVSIGGQSYGSITEDCNTSLTLTTCGFSSMYVGDRIVYGLAPDDLDGVLSQRLRWSMGSLQILLNNNPLSVSGLSAIQKFLFFDVVSYPLMSIPMAVFVLIPVIFCFSFVSAVNVTELWEFCIIFGVFWIVNRSMWLYVAVGTYGGETELWRSWQAFIWSVPNNLKAIWKVMTAEMTFFSRIFKKKAISFKVTDKSNTSSKPSYDWKNFWLVFPYLCLYATLLAALIVIIVFAATRNITLGDLIGGVFGLMRTVVACVCVWPVVSTLFPRKATEEGWEIQWTSGMENNWGGVGKVALSKRASSYLSRIALLTSTVLGDAVDGVSTVELNRPKQIISETDKEPAVNAGVSSFSGKTNGKLPASPFMVTSTPGLQRSASLLGMSTSTFLQVTNSSLGQTLSTAGAINKRKPSMVNNADFDLIDEDKDMSKTGMAQEKTFSVSPSQARYSQAVCDIFNHLQSVQETIELPVDAAAVFEQAIDAQPSFQDLETPAVLHVYVVITVVLTLSLVAIGVCSGLDLF